VARIGGTGTGTVGVRVLHSALVPDNHLFRITFNANSDQVHANSYNLIDSTTGQILFKTGDDFSGLATGISGAGIQPVVYTIPTVIVDSATTGFAPGSQTNAKLSVVYSGLAMPITLRRAGFPYDMTVTFSNTVIDTAEGLFGSRRPVKFRIVAHTPEGDLHLHCRFTDQSPFDSTLSPDPREVIQVLTGPDSMLTSDRYTWAIKISNPGAGTTTPTAGDVYEIHFLYPFTTGDEFTFTSKAEFRSADKAKQQFSQNPYVVPNPYVGAASFEPGLFATSGRGDRRIEFRGIPQGCTIRIYTVRGDLVRTLVHDGSTEGFVAWDLRTKDNLDVAPGLYVYHVDGGTVGTYVGKLAIIK
jgi:hypothetical protein